MKCNYDCRYYRGYPGGYIECTYGNVHQILSGIDDCTDFCYEHNCTTCNNFEYTVTPVLDDDGNRIYDNVSDPRCRSGLKLVCDQGVECKGWFKNDQ